MLKGPGSANFELAARFAPYKVRDLVHSTRVAPRWIEDSDRFWYQWESSAGTNYYLVDAARGTRTEIFDNDRIAAELTRITRDPWDAQHLPIRNIRFIDEGTLQFEVQSSQDEEIEEEEEEEEEDEEEDEDVEEEQEEERAPSRPRTRKKVHHFEYDVATQTLRELEDREEPLTHPFWASVSPDTAWVVFAREFNLWMMSYEEYEKILEARQRQDGGRGGEGRGGHRGRGDPAHDRRRAALLVGIRGPRPRTTRRPRRSSRSASRRAPSGPTTRSTSR